MDLIEEMGLIVLSFQKRKTHVSGTVVCQWVWVVQTDLAFRSQLFESEVHWRPQEVQNLNAPPCLGPSAMK